MNKKITRYLAILFLIFVNFLSAQSLDIYSLEKEIIKHNREGKHTLSQKKLSELLFSADLTKEEEANILYYMATTYRGLNDNMMCIDYLNKSNAIAKDLPKDNILRMKLDYEYAFAYFDNREYDKSKKMMDYIAAQKYSQVIPEDQSYILIQEGYLFFRKKDFVNAEKKYHEALQIMKTSSYCNLPILYIKMMELYGQMKDIKKVESLYTESLELSKTCGILKYEIFTASQMQIIYNQNELLSKAFSIGLKVDSLKKIENLENRISQMHIIDKKYWEKKASLENESDFWKKIFAFVIATILLLVIAFSVFKSHNLKIEKIKMGKEIEQIKEDLNTYSQKTHLEEKFVSQKSSIINSDQLTDRQKELVELMAEGFSNKEIAEKLFITESTVKYHIKNIYSVLELKDRKDFFKKMNNI